MNIYNYDIEKIYIGTSKAKTNPLSPREHLIPANSTTVEAPKEKEGYARRFDIETETWSYIEDNIGTEYVTELSPLSKIQTLTEYGELPDGAIKVSLLATDEDGEYYSCYMDSINENTGLYEADTKTIEYNEVQTLAKTEYNWVTSELETLDIKVNKASDGEDLEFSESYYRCMRKALRSYVNLSDGMYSTADLTDKTYTFDNITYSIMLDDNKRPLSLKILE